jgi:hypothetical protein
MDRIRISICAYTTRRQPMLRVLTGAMLLAFCVAANAAVLEKWGPTWSEVTGYRYSKAKMNRLPAIIKSIDGTDTTFRVVKMDPGERTIVIQSPQRKGFRGSDKTLQLTIEPCKRYYINAQFESSVGVDWEPVIDYVEKIAGCKLTAPTK